jgi:predicted nucleic acid-binding protein
VRLLSTVELANRRDPDHRRCVEAWAPLRAKFVTVEGVLVEAAHLMRRVPDGGRAAFEIARSVQTMFVPPAERLYSRAFELMKRYRNVPMDFVDALLVAPADELSVTEVLTLDRRGFETYRSSKGAFSIIPSENR